MSLNFKKKSTSKERQGSSPSSSQVFEDDEYAKVIEGIKRIYKQKIKPLEVTYNFEGNNWLLKSKGREKTKLILQQAFILHL